jgi:Caspase domain
MTNRAVVIGINDYSNQASLPPGWTVGNLSSCVADAQAMADLLVGSFGFDPGITVLTDAAASRDAIIQAIQSMLAGSVPGDVACVVYSGHGGRFPADASSPNRYYEAIIPASDPPITDLDVFNLANSLDQSTVNFTLILDCCHSGGIHEGTPDSAIRSVSYTDDYIQACTGQMNTVIPCGVTLAPGDSSMDGNVSNVVGQGNGIVCSVDDNKSLVPLSKSTVVAACRYDEDALEQGGHGALTQGILNLITSSDPQADYIDLMDQLRAQMQTMNVTQTPTLLGQENRMNEVFLAPWTTSA